MVTFDFIILFLIAAWTASFHAMMISKNPEIAQGRMYMTLFFAVLFIASLITKSGVFL